MHRIRPLRGPPSFRGAQQNLESVARLRAGQGNGSWVPENTEGEAVFRMKSIMSEVLGEKHFTGGFKRPWTFSIRTSSSAKG